MKNGLLPQGNGFQGRLCRSVVDNMDNENKAWIDQVT